MFDDVKYSDDDIWKYHDNKEDIFPRADFIFFVT